MRDWNYLQLTIPVENHDVASGILWELGTNGIEEQPSKKGWIRLKTFFDCAQDIEAVAAQFHTACRKAGIIPRKLVSKRQKEKDWLKVWREALKPFPIGKRFYLIPTPDRAGELPENRIPLWLQPGMAFGTGTHQSTQLCLEALEEAHLHEKRLLDIGTGSGILAIAAVRLGCRKVVACDIDQEAIRTAQANSVANQCDQEIDWVPGAIERVKSRSFDVIVANLTARIIVAEVGAMCDRLVTGGSIILSGILDTQSPQVLQALKGIGATRCLTRRKGEWVCLIARKI